MFVYLAEHGIAGRTTEVLDLLKQFEGASARRREIDIECARILARLSELDGWSFAGCVSAGELGERFAVPAADTRSLLGCGRAMAALPYVEQQVRTGRITVASAGCLGEVLTNPALQRDEDDWIGWAQSESTQSLKKRVDKRKEELRFDAPPIAMTLFVSTKERDDFQRARTIASRKASQLLTEGQTLACVVDHYLDCYDDERTAPGKRRLPDTAFVNGRYVPMAVRREVYERQGQRCAVPMCDNTIYIELAHLFAHACGGSREADNLVLLCSQHHFLFDSGTIRLVGTADKPRFFSRHGEDLTRRFERGDFLAWANPAPGFEKPPESDPMRLPEPPGSADPPGPAPP